MVYYGENISNSHKEQLLAISLEELYNKIASPEESLIRICKELQQIKQIDNKAFNRHKIRLPYFCGAEFTGNIRKTENFKIIKYFVLDIDHCFEFSDMDKEDQLKKQLASDQRIVLMFLSPSSTGLKLVFSLSEPLDHSKRFADFYLAFASIFARQYGLEKFVDFKTHDVTRVCFLNVDPMAHYNSSFIKVDASQYVSSLDVFANEDPGTNDQKGDDEGKTQSINEDTFKKILQTLNPKTPKRKKSYYVPEILEEIVVLIKTAMDEKNIEITNVSNIQYGKKFRFQLEGAFAEINIYYGKHGFSVVKTPKTDVDELLNEISYRIACSTIYEFEHHHGLIDLHNELMNDLKKRTNELLN